MTYAEKLKDPRWQKKRLEIFERDGFACRLCRNKKATLNVHHHLYERGKDPWEYSNDVLDTLCNKCHAVVEHSKTAFPSLGVIQIYYKDTGGEIDLAFVVFSEKQNIHLAVLNYYSENHIEFVVNIPSNIIKLVHALTATAQNV